MVVYCYVVIDKWWAVAFGIIMTVGLSLSDGLRLGASKDCFMRPHCSTANSNDVDSHVIAPVVDDYPFTPNVDFQWGDITGKQFCDLITSAYEEVVHWKHNVFMIPFGKAGKAFVKELAKLYQAFADHSALHSIALMACSVMQPLLLQKPFKNSKAKDHSTHLSRRLALWRKGSLDILLNECRCIQEHLKVMPRSQDTSRLFDHLMSEGKVNMAFRLLSLDASVPSGATSSGDQLYRTVREVLVEKHPKGRPADSDVLLDFNTERPCYDPVIFEYLTCDMIKRASLHTHGAAGPSGVDAYAWRRICTSFGDASVTLCGALASVACCIATAEVDSTILMPFVACRLIPLGKRPGVHPIGIGDVPRRITAKAILYSVSDDIVSAVGPLQTCTGHVAGSEAAVHTMRDVFNADDSEGILLVDASNAFDSINRQAALHNISILHPALSTVLQNTYSATVQLFVVREGEIPSTEGTTQGDPLAMAMYALAVVPLIAQLHAVVPDAKQVWFADDATAVGSLSSIFNWWWRLSSVGPKFGYFPNASETVLIVKPEHLANAHSIFADTNIQVAAGGQRHLGAALGSHSFTKEYVTQKVAD